MNTGIVRLLILLSLLFIEVSAKGKGGSVHVKGYYRKDGTYVQPHYRSAPDGNFSNNWSTKGNVNPFTGEEGTRVSPPNSGTTTSSSYSSAPSTGAYSFTSPSKINETYSGAKNPDIQRAEYWSKQGYSFDPNYMTAYSMDRKVQDIQRAKYWSERGYSFDPNYMTAYSMDRKVQDIQRAKHWSQQGYTFDPNYMTAYSMDRKVADIERSKYWMEKGYNFDPNYMTAYSMDRKVQDIERAKYWKTKGFDFNPDYMTSYSMDREANRAIQSGK